MISLLEKYFGSNDWKGKIQQAKSFEAIPISFEEKFFVEKKDAVQSALRIGKHITLHVDAPTKDEADKHVRDACKRLLANQVMEAFDFTLTEA